MTFEEDEKEDQEVDGPQDQDQYQAIEDDEEEEVEEQFDHLIPANWQEIADMRLRQLDKEYE